MKFNFFFISYSVIYAKYSYCYEVPKNMPVKYFDGKEWKIMKPRHQIGMGGLKRPNLLKLDWTGFSNENDTSTIHTTRKTITGKGTTKKTTTRRPTTKTTTKPKPKHTTKKINLRTMKATETIKYPQSVYSILSKQKKVPISKRMMTRKRFSWATTRLTKKPPAKTTKKPCSPTLKIPSSSKNDAPKLPEDWVRIMREFVAAIKSMQTKNCTHHEPETTVEPFTYLLADGRRAEQMTGIEDLMNILTDGVQIDDRPDNEASLNEALVGLNELLGSNEVTLDLGSKQSSISKDLTVNTDIIQDLRLNSYLEKLISRHGKEEDATPSNHGIKDVFRISGFKEYLDNFKAKNSVKEDKILQTSQIKFKDKNEKEIDEPIQDDEINAYIEILKAKYSTKDHLKNKNACLDLVKSEILKLKRSGELKNHQPRVEENDLKPYLNQYSMQNILNNIDFSQGVDLSSLCSMLNDRRTKIPNDYLNNRKDVYNKENNNTLPDVMRDSDEMEAFIASNYSESTETKDRANNEDYLLDDLVDNDLSVYLDASEDDVLTDNYSTEDIDLEETIHEEELSDNYGYDNWDEMDEQNETAHNSEDSLNFQYALDDKEQNNTTEENKFLLDW